MKNSNKVYSKGFTLIELLVVIAIIAILSTVVMAGLNSARQKGRDAKRVGDIKSVQTALELFNDSCGGYPGTAAAGALSAIQSYSTGCSAPTNMTTFIAVLPVNPSPGGAPTGYRYCGSADGLSCTGAAANQNNYIMSFATELDIDGAGPLTTTLRANGSGLAAGAAI